MLLPLTRSRLFSFSQIAAIDTRPEGTRSALAGKFRRGEAASFSRDESPGDGPVTFAFGTRPPTRRVLRPGVEKSTPFSGGRYQDDQPYHHLPFSLPCAFHPRRRRCLAASFLRRTSAWRASPLAPSHPFGEKSRSSAAFCRGGATSAIKNHPERSPTHTRPFPPFLVRWSSSQRNPLPISLFSRVCTFQMLIDFKFVHTHCMCVCVCKGNERKKWWI